MRREAEPVICLRTAKLPKVSPLDELVSDARMDDPMFKEDMLSDDLTPALLLKSNPQTSPVTMSCVFSFCIWGPGAQIYVQSDTDRES